MVPRIFGGSDTSQVASALAGSGREEVAQVTTAQVARWAGRRRS
ncbi:hypothetical protein [Mycolicibacterium sarraceniae]|nr:hypothetical protein [Mycolicibacterium sarraceniae]